MVLTWSSLASRVLLGIEVVAASAAIIPPLAEQIIPETTISCRSFSLFMIGLRAQHGFMDDL
jgi:hypothetical protein